MNLETLNLHAQCFVAMNATRWGSRPVSFAVALDSVTIAIGHEVHERARSSLQHAERESYKQHLSLSHLLASATAAAASNPCHAVSDFWTVG